MMGLSVAAIFLLCLVVFAVVILMAGVKTVPQGYVWTVERFGRFHGLLHPGLNVIVPFIDAVGRRINTQESVLEIPKQRVITKDNASVEVDGIVFYTVLDPARAAYAVQNLQAAIINLALTNIRTAIGAMDLDETLSMRERINVELLRVLDLATEVWGAKVNRVELKDVNPPEDVVASMAKQLAADRQARAAVLQAEGVRKAVVLQAEGEKQSQILAAEGRLAAAEKDAMARERLAQAEAKATQLVSDAVRDGNTAALNYFIAQRYTEALTKLGTGTNAKLIMLPLEAAGIAGSIAGIAELVKAGLSGAPTIASRPSVPTVKSEPPGPTVPKA
jgi:regulator of protease activity HflC (stomatin/prohibitin superfamily)